MRETEKPQLDEKALEAAIKAYDDARHKDQSSSDDMAEAIRAYLGALPPAKQAWAFEVEAGNWPVFFERDVPQGGNIYANPRYYEVEIREVRQP